MGNNSRLLAFSVACTYHLLSNTQGRCLTAPKGFKGYVGFTHTICFNFVWQICGNRKLTYHVDKFIVVVSLRTWVWYVWQMVQRPTHTPSEVMKMFHMCCFFNTHMPQRWFSFFQILLGFLSSQRFKPASLQMTHDVPVICQAMCVKICGYYTKCCHIRKLVVSREMLETYCTR
jgi:hypothetical protein